MEDVTFRIDRDNAHYHNKVTKTLQFNTVDGKTKPGLQNYFSSLSVLGQHYHVVSLGNDGVTPFKVGSDVIRRQYTIANCLERNQYKAIIDILLSNGISVGTKNENIEEKEKLNTDGSREVKYAPYLAEKEFIAGTSVSSFVSSAG